MTRKVVIEFHDAGLQIADDQGVSITSPAVLVQSTGAGKPWRDFVDVAVGSEAAKLSRQNPRLTWHAYWQDVNQQPLQSPPASGKQSLATNADLAWLHLSRLWQQYLSAMGDADCQVVLLTPEVWSGEALALLLGIAQACQIPVVGMAESYRLAAKNTVNVPFTVFDMGPTRLVMTHIDSDNVAQAKVIANTGLLALYDKCATNIAREFVAQTRFDPLHHAQSEQRLYDELPRVLHALCQESSTVLQLASSSHNYSLDIPRELLMSEFTGLIDLLVEQAVGAGSVLLSQRLESIPGLVPALERHSKENLSNSPVRCLSVDASIGSALQCFGRLVSEGKAPLFIRQFDGDEREPDKDNQAVA